MQPSSIKFLRTVTLGFAALSVTAIAPILSQKAFAENEITVQDTSGFTRAVSEVEQTGKIEFTVVGENNAPADGMQIQLMNPDTGEIITSRAVAGSVVFDGVAPGIWVVSTTATGLTFTGITITSLGVGGVVTGVGSLGTVLGFVGGSAAVVGVSLGVAEANDNNNDDSPVSPFR